MLAAVIAVVAIQNTEPVVTRLLFATVTMPHAILLFTTAAIGFGIGTLATLFWVRGRGGAS